MRHSAIAAAGDDDGDDGDDLAFFGVDMVTIQALPRRVGLACCPCGSGWNDDEREANPRSRPRTGASFIVVAVSFNVSISNR